MTLDEMRAVLPRRLLRSQTGCLNYMGKLDIGGYGYFSGPNRNGRIQAHRVAYETEKGPIPAGLVIDHLCRNRRCCNPDHMEPVAHWENTRRGDAPTAVNARATHCAHGHEFTTENTRYRGPDRRWRMCRQCQRKKNREWEVRSGRDRNRNR